MVWPFLAFLKVKEKKYVLRPVHIGKISAKLAIFYEILTLNKIVFSNF
jgi:hypothetical protein